MPVIDINLGILESSYWFKTSHLLHTLTDRDVLDKKVVIWVKISPRVYSWKKLV